MSQFAIKPLADEPQIRSALGDLLIETVASGGSVGFMHPLSPGDPGAIWQDSLGAAFGIAAELGIAFIHHRRPLGGGGITGRSCCIGAFGALRRTALRFEREAPFSG